MKAWFASKPCWVAGVAAGVASTAGLIGFALVALYVTRFALFIPIGGIFGGAVYFACKDGRR